MQKTVISENDKKFVGYINLYKYRYGDKLLHYSGGLYKTKKEALRYKDKYRRIGKNYFIGEVFVTKGA